MHDEIGQSLTAAAIDAERAAQQAPAAASALLQGIAASLQRSVEDVRRIARELRPEALDDLGLVNALIALCRRISAQSELPIQRHFDPDLPPRSREVDLVIYRVAQESLTNVVRHAAASKAEISVTHRNGTITLAVNDDGRGMRTQTVSANTAGLAGMRERAMLVGGSVMIASQLRAGTRVQLDIPVARSA